MKTFHLKFANDYTARVKHQELGVAIKAAGGAAHVSPSFGNGPAFVVAQLPEDVDPKSIFGEHEFTEPELEDESDESEKDSGDSVGDSNGSEGEEQGLKAKRQPLSGALKDLPNDVVIENDIDKVLVECKVRSVHLNAAGKRMITIDLDWLQKVITHAEEKNFSAGVVVFRPKYSPKLYAVLDTDVLLDLLVEANPLLKVDSPTATRVS